MTQDQESLERGVTSIVSGASESAPLRRTLPSLTRDLRTLPKVAVAREAIGASTTALISSRLGKGVAMLSLRPRRAQAGAAAAVRVCEEEEA